MKLIVANWKMHPETLEQAKALALAEDTDQAVICPPTKFLSEIKLVNAKLGSQDMDLPADKLASLGVKYAILGHSERRLNHGETDEMVNKKILDALENNITPILCLGENYQDQYANCTKGLSATELQKIIYTYEPAFAISTMKDSHPVPADKARIIIDEIHKLVGLNSKVLYGGTVNKDDVHEYAKFTHIGGALVGAASLDPDNFLSVIEAFNE